MLIIFCTDLSQQVVTSDKTFLEYPEIGDFGDLCMDSLALFCGFFITK